MLPSPCNSGPWPWRRHAGLSVPWQRQAQADCQWNHGCCMTLQAFPLQVPLQACPSSPSQPVRRAACRIAGLPRDGLQDRCWDVGEARKRTDGSPTFDTTGITSHRIASPTLPKAKEQATPSSSWWLGRANAVAIWAVMCGRTNDDAHTRQLARPCHWTGCLARQCWGDWPHLPDPGCWLGSCCHDSAGRGSWVAG
jgi:hypothetical protein